MNDALLTMYAVRNKDGQYFRAKGYNGCGASWVSDLNKGRIYRNISQARARVTWFASNYPQYGVPELVELRVTEIVAIDESERVKKSWHKKAKKQAKQFKQILQDEMDRARKQLEEAQGLMDRIGKPL